ncbi:MAG: ABC transporter substrate-binding protein [Beutenbergiaceae bacterium]
MATTRRQFLTLASLGAAGIGLAACTNGGGSGGGGGGGGGGSTNLQFTWWGNEVRNANTTEAIDAYMAANDGISVEAQPGEWASYWDRLATQTAGNTMPDIIQMDMKYISEYGQRGALLDLEEHGVEVSAFTEGTVDTGRIDGKLYGVNAGVNTSVLMINPGLIEGLGLQVPDDKSWTWDDLREFAASVKDASSGEVAGIATLIWDDAFFEAWLRQQDKGLFVEGNQLGCEADDVAGWFDWHLQLLNEGGSPEATAITEDQAVSLDQQMFATGRSAMSSFWSNQLEAVSNAAGTDLAMLRAPSMAGDATQRKAWYKASMLWSASARSENPEAAVEMINWWVNSSEAAAINLAERGIPANADIAAEINPSLSPLQQDVAAFIDEIIPELSDTPVAPPPGGGQVQTLLLRHGQEVLFGNSSAADAGQAFYDELSSSIS